ncbi:MAG TPA: hypothetical protein PLS34_05460 [Gammaproteobacteria bacterium]|nr:hypothetical protein [Gammaproteobacteria bacterium]
MLRRFTWAALDEAGRAAALARPEAAQREALAAQVAAIIAETRRERRVQRTPRLRR